MGLKYKGDSPHLARAKSNSPKNVKASHAGILHTVRHSQVTASAAAPAPAPPVSKVLRGSKENYYEHLNKLFRGVLKTNYYSIEINRTLAKS